MPRTIRHWTPRYVFNRLLYALHQHQNPQAPWLTRQAVQMLDEYLAPNHAGVEWGSGRSTMWFAERVGRLTSIEHNPKWHGWVQDQIDQRGLHNVDYHLAPIVDQSPIGSIRYLEIVRQIAPASLDFALVDGQLRDRCTEAAMALLRPGGLLIIDNAEQYFPQASYAPSSMLSTHLEQTPTWPRLRAQLAKWGCQWTSNGVWDTALFTKPSEE